MTLQTDPDCLEKVHHFVREKAKIAGFSSRDVGRLVLATDEVCSNILRHTYRFATHRTLSLAWKDQGENIVIEVQDDSQEPYLPSPVDFDLATKLKYRHTNGYGKYLIRKMVDDVQYETIPGSHNRVMLIKFREGHGPRKKEASSQARNLVRTQNFSLQSLFEVSEISSRALSSQKLLDLYLYSVLGKVSAQPLVLFVSKGVTSPFTLMGQIGLSRRLEKETLELSRHGWVVETLWAHRGPFLTDKFKALRIPEAEWKTLESIRSQVLIPIFILNRLRGILSLGSKRTSVSFSEEDINYATHLMSHLILLMEGSTKETSPEPSPMGVERADLRAIVRAALVKVASTSGNSRVAFNMADSSEVLSVKIDQELLQQILVTLLTHVLYVADGEGEISLSLETRMDKALLKISYLGTLLTLEKGETGYNTLVERILADGIPLHQMKKKLESLGGNLKVESEDTLSEGPCHAVVTFSLPRV